MKPTYHPHLSSPRLALLLLSLLLALAEITPTSLAQGRILIYVDADANGANNGTSWANAYTHLQDALDQTNANSGADYEIWVAEGVYYPDEESVGSQHTANSESEYFTLSYNNVQIYGGFAGTETSRDQRNWTTHPTILSGDIDGNDLNTDGNHIAETGDDIQGDNADHVLYLDGVSNESIDAAVVIDGFIITAGQADGNNNLFTDVGGGLHCIGTGSDHECSPSLVNISFSGNSAAAFGGGMYNDGSSSGKSNPNLVNVSFSSNAATGGGGMFNQGYSSGESSPSLVNVSFSGHSTFQGGGMFNSGSSSGVSNPRLFNVTFTNNSASQGGGIYNDGYSSGESSPHLINVTFTNNSADDEGAGIYNAGTSNPILINVNFSGNSAIYFGGGIFNGNNSSPSLVNVNFSGNSAFYGGGMYNYGDGGNSSPSLVNVSFSGNSAYSGGGLYNNGSYSGNSSPSLVNVSFTDNSATYGGGMYNYGPLGESSPSLVNVILWGNTASTAGPQIYNESATPTFTHSLVEGGISGLGTDGGNNLDQDPLFVDAANGNLRLQSGSPAIDAGLTAALPADTFDLDGDGNTTETIPFDLAGRPRHQGSAVDIGAYEFNLGNTAPTISEGDSVEVTMNVNGAPVAFSLTLHASDPEADILTWSLASQANHGAASVSGTGSSQAISYIPDPDYVGTDSFVVQVSDGALSDTITVTVNITAEEIGQNLYLPVIIK